MSKPTLALIGTALAATACRCPGPPPWQGPGLTQPRTALTIDDLTQDQALPLMDLSFFARPAWAVDSPVPFSGSVTLSQAAMLAPKDRDAYQGEDLFPALTIDFISHDQALIPMVQGVIDTRPDGDSYWDASVEIGAVWQEPDDDGWSRASFPVNLMGRYVGEVRNCVATFMYDADRVSNTYLQCSQETAVLDADQLGDIRAMVPTTYTPRDFPDADAFLDQHEQAQARRVPTAPLSDVDVDDQIADHFACARVTSASTSLGAVSIDGQLYVHPPMTRHGVFPYPDGMRHGVFSVTKSMGGALAMFHLAERYGDDVFDQLIVDYVPALQGLPEWQGVTFSHALNMVTGTRAGEDLLYEPLELAPDKETAISNIAQFGDFPEAPGEKFNYATTNTFVLSYALDTFVRQQEGDDVHYWDLVQQDVLTPIGVEGFDLLYTRDEDPAERIPILGLGAFPSLDDAARIAALIADEGEFEGQQLLSRQRIREALGRTDWEGYKAFSGLRYRHSFWVDSVRTGGCKVELSYMEGLGDNRIIFFPSGAVSFQFTDEFDCQFKPLVRAVERLASSCE